MVKIVSPWLTLVASFLESPQMHNEIHVENHSSANDLQVPNFLIRRAAKKVTFSG